MKVRPFKNNKSPMVISELVPVAATTSKCLDDQLMVVNY